MVNDQEDQKVKPTSKTNIAVGDKWFPTGRDKRARVIVWMNGTALGWTNLGLQSPIPAEQRSFKEWIRRTKATKLHEVS